MGYKVIKDNTRKASMLAFVLMVGIMMAGCFGGGKEKVEDPPLTISPEQFAAQFNAGAELFGIDSRISGDMEFSQGENGQTARHDFSETAILNLVRPDETSPLSGAVLGLIWRNDLEMLAGLQHFWTLVAALEPGMTDAAIQDFTQVVLGASGGSVYSKSGIEFKAQELNDQSIFVFAHMKK